MSLPTPHVTCQHNVLMVVVIVLSSLTHCHRHSLMFVLFMTLVQPYLNPPCSSLCCRHLRLHFVVHMIIVLAMAFVIVVVVAYKLLLWSTFIILVIAFVFILCTLFDGHLCHDTIFLVALDVTFMMVAVVNKLYSPSLSIMLSTHLHFLRCIEFWCTIDA